MNYIEFDKEKLANITSTKKKELLFCSRTGAFATTSLSGLNTRKYHGLFIVPQDNIDGERYILMSNLNETIVINNMEFHLGIHQYNGGVINPKGNKYLEKFTAEPTPTYHFHVGKFHFIKELLFVQNREQLIIKYTFLEDFESAAFQFQPLLAFRQIHHLTHENNTVNTQFENVDNGVKYCLYPNFTPIFLQCSAPIFYEHQPTWFHNFEYEMEAKRGYDCHEDLINLGSINVPISSKEIYFSVGTEATEPQDIATLFETEKRQQNGRLTYFTCLQHAANQFIIERNGKTEVMAGYPWFGRWGRDTFIALPGLTLAVGKPDLCKKILDTMLREMQNGLFPNMGNGAVSAYNSVDAPLWFFRALQQYAEFTNSKKKIWQEYGTAMQQILNAYKNGALYNIKMLENGLIYAGGDGVALTWMDAVVNGVPVTPRTGCQVEINGLWYNAVCFAIEVAKLAKEKDFVDEWEPLMRHFPDVFKETFWSKERGYLADFVNGDYKNFQVRPNMMIVTSLPYTPISEKIRQLILKRTCEELLTEKGIRTLSPNDPDYKGYYRGNQAERDSAYHQGTCWIWLLAPFADGMLAVYQKSAIPVLEKLLYHFDGCMKKYGIGTIAEITDGDPPHRPNGCISQAWSVSALLYLKWLIETKYR